MATKRLLLLPLAVLLGVSAPRPALADDNDLLNRSTPAPNVLIILDTSQSMTWFRAPRVVPGSCNPLGSVPPPLVCYSRGDEYPGWTGGGTDNTPTARMAMAKSVLSTVVDTYFSKLRFGLASYAEGGTSANPNTNVQIRRYWY